MTKPARILVVDDNPAERYVTSRVLRSGGFEVVEAANGARALAAANSSIDLVVLDINLPDIDGFSVCRALRERPETAGILVLHLSATYTTESDRLAGLAGGADAYLTHPVEPPVLLGAVNSLLRLRFAEVELRRTESKFQAIFNSVPSGISLLSRDGNYTEVNPAMCRLLGLPREKIVGRHKAVFVPADRSEDFQKIESELESRGEWRGSLPLLRNDGSQVETDWNITVHHPSGTRFAIATDVTWQRQLESERERLLVSERSARGQAERANRMKDEFLSMLGHELRNPLAALSNGVALLQANLSPERRVLVDQMMSRQVHQLQRLVDDLLDVTRISLGKIEIRKRLLELSESVEAAVEDVQTLLKKHRHQLSVILPKEPVCLQADPVRLQQMLVNLLTNAAKYMADGGRVWLSAEIEGDQVVMRCRDEGVGISQDMLDVVFEPFVQINSTPDRSNSGLGVGLTLVRKLAEMHGGSVTASSRGAGEGTEFVLRLPVAPSEEWQKAPARLPVADRTVSDPLRILLVEDNADVAEGTAMLLESAGHLVTVAPDGQTGIAKAIDERPDVILLDVGLPGMDGYAVANRLRTMPDLKDTMIVAVSGYNPEQGETKSARFDAHLVKPVDFDRLGLLLEQKQKDRRSEGPPAAR